MGGTHELSQGNNGLFILAGDVGDHVDHVLLALGHLNVPEGDSSSMAPNIKEGQV